MCLRGTMPAARARSNEDSRRGIQYEVRHKRDARRLDALLTVIYLIFNEGYVATQGGTLVRTDLSSEAIRSDVGNDADVDPNHLRSNCTGASCCTRFAT